MQPRWVSGGLHCVDDELLFALARGELAQDELAPVESHLRDCSDCRAVLGEAARSLPTQAEASSELSGPRRIARFELRDLVGAGASGVVYRAFDEKLQRIVALKVLHGERQASPELSLRMLREAQAMARLSAATVVTVYDVGIEHGAVYLVMEYIDGSTLATWLRSGPRSASEILAVFADAGRGLSAAHDKGLVHRDFKPENVLVASDGRARVTDFGLSREAQSLPSNSALDPSSVVGLYAPTRGLVGTPAYIAPELFAGALATAGSDQYAFCVALFAALFGRHPFRAGEGITLEQLMHHTREYALLKPAELKLRGARMLRLHRVLERGLSPDPTQRFRHMDELLGALERASAPPLRRGVMGAFAASLLLLTVWFAARSAGHEADALAPRSVPGETRAAPAVRVERAVQTAPASSTRATPTPSVGPEAAAPQDAAARQPEKRRAKRKSGEVRYRDWLKDPF
jgi:predicted Ser/Thr protein kinase